MYNELTKQQFLTTTRSPEAYTPFFLMSESFEYRFNKDVYDFTISELKTLYKHIKPTTEQHAEVIFKLLDQYTNWSIKEGLRNSSVSPFMAFMEEWSHQFIVK